MNTRLKWIDPDFDKDLTGVIEDPEEYLGADYDDVWILDNKTGIVYQGYAGGQGPDGLTMTEAVRIYCEG